MITSLVHRTCGAMVALCVAAGGGYAGMFLQPLEAEALVAQRINRPEPLKTLTLADVRNLLDIEQELIPILQELAKGEGSKRRDESVILGTSPSVAEFEEAAAGFEKEPKIRVALSKYQWNGVEYLRTFYATIAAVMEVEVSRRNAVPLGANARLLSSLPAEVATRFDDWKRIRMGPTLDLWQQSGDFPPSSRNPE